MTSIMWLLCAGGNPSRKLARALQTDVFDDKSGDPVDIPEIELRQDGLDLVVAGHSDDMRILRMQHRLANHAPVNLELWNRLVLETFDQQKIAGRNMLNEFLQRRFGRAAQFVHQRPPPARRNQHLVAPCMTMAIRVFTR